LHTLLAEFKDAEKRFDDIYKKISKLVIPPADILFNGDLRDKLLFEDEEFTYSRRYFWGYQTLGIMKDSIKAIIDAYEDTFTDDVWEGKHKTLWPMIDEKSSRNAHWRHRMAKLKKEFEKTIEDLYKLYEENDKRRKEIRTLRDQLFSGTSVLESRKSVELSEVTILQGHNIKLLTLVSRRYILEMSETNPRARSAFSFCH
jgi:spermidine/putrescine-binding protein